MPNRLFYSFACCLLLAATPLASAQLGPLAPGEIVVTEFFDDFFRIDPVTGALTEVPNTGFTFQSPIAIDPLNRIVGMQRISGFDEMLVRYDPATGSVTQLTTRVFDNVDDLVVEPDGSILVIEQDNLLRVNPGTGAVFTLVDNDLVNGGFFSPYKVSVGRDGRIFVNEFFEGLYEIDPVTGGATEVPVLNNVLNPNSPFDVLGVQPDGDLIFSDSGILYSLDPDTGDFSAFASSLPGSPSEIAIDENGGVILITNDDVLRYDAQGGSPEVVVSGITFFSPHDVVVARDLTHLPEPGSLALLLGGCLFVIRRRH